MWKIKRLHLENILSHERSTVVFQNQKVTFIVGENLDDEGANSNGSGKSVLIEAITIALVGSSYRDISKDDFIRDGCSKAKVELTLQHSVNKDQIIIERLFHRNSVSRLNIIKNGKSLSNITSVDEGNRYILETLLDIDKQDLLDYFIVGQGNQSSFLTATDAGKKTIISRLCKLDSLVSIDELLKKQLRDFLIKTSVVDNKIQDKEDLLMDLQNQLDQEKNRRNEEAESLIKEHVSNIVRFSEEVEQCENKSKILHSKRAALTEQLSNLSEENKNLTLIVNEIEILSNKIKNINRIIIENENKIQHIEAQIKGLTTCPHCNKKFSLHTKATDKSLLASKKQVEDQLQQERNRKQSTQNKLKEQEQIYSEKKDIENKIKSINADLYSLNSSIRSNSLAKEDLNRKIIVSKKRIEELNKKFNNQVYIDQIQDKIQKETANITLLRKERQDLSVEEGQLSNLQYHFSRPGFQTYLIHQVLRHIENLTNYYLQSFATNLSCTISGYSQNKKGDVREKIDIMVHRGGQAIKFNKLSGGEKNRLQLASILAQQSLFNQSSKSGGIDLLVLDETFENLDRKGQQELMRCLDALRQTVICISHQADNITSFPVKVIRVQKQNRVSKII